MKGWYKTMAISTEKLLKLSQFQTGLTASKTYTDAKVKTVSDLVGVIPESATATTVVGYVDEKTSGIATDANLQIVEGKINTLVGEDTNKSARAIAAEETAKIVAGADASYDTLKEIADWISSHTTDAAAMNSAILALQAIVDGIGGEGEKATVVAYVDDAIAALKIGDYAKAADLTALAGRVSALETGKADKDGAVLTGTPTAPTADEGTNNDQIATTAFVQNAIEQAIKLNVTDDGNGNITIS